MHRPETILKKVLTRISNGEPFDSPRNRLDIHRIAREADVFRLEYANNLPKLQAQLER